MGNFLKVLAVPALSLRQLIAGHIHFLKQSLNPIFETKESEILTKKDEKYMFSSASAFYFDARLHSGFVIFLQLYTVLYGIFGFIPLSSIHSFKDILQSELLYSHQILPKIAWPQLDAGISMDIFVSLIIFSIISLKREESLKYRIIYPIALKEILINKRKLTPKESKSILKMYLVVKYLLVPGGAAFGMLCNVGFGSHAYYRGVTPFFKPLTLFFWTVAFPGQIFYILYTSFGPIFYVFFVSAVIQVQQKTLITCLSKKVRRRKLQFTDFTRFNQKYLHLCTFIAEYSCHCKPLLSTTIPYLVCVQCYMLYIVLFQSLPLTLTIVFILTCLELELFLLALVEQCARVSKLNGVFERLNKQFYLMVIFRGWLENSNGEIEELKEIHEKRGVCLLKVQAMQLNKRLRLFAFQLVGDYVINQKTFPTVLVYIVTAFIFVVKSNSNNSH